MPQQRTRLGSIGRKPLHHDIAVARRTAPLVLEDMRRQCEELLAAGVIRKLRPGEKPTYVSPVVMVRNPNKPGFRMCQDLRELNYIKDSNIIQNAENTW